MIVELRDATAADLDAVERIEGRCFPQDPWSRGMLHEELGRAGGIFLVAEEPAGQWSRRAAPGGVAGGGKPPAPGSTSILGFAIGWRVLDEVHVLQIAVDPDAQRTGLGRRLVEALHTAAPHADLAWLEVRNDNVPAIGLYEGLGYAVIARRPRYYGDGTDGLVMRRDLRAARGEGQ